MNPVRHYPVMYSNAQEYAAGISTADTAPRDLKPPVYCPRRAEYGHEQRAAEMHVIRDEVIAWSLIALATVGLLSLVGYAWTVMQSIAGALA